jgi:thioesterase domain-containing protein
MPPLFCISGKGGSVIALRPLAEALGPEQPLYGVTHHGIDPGSLPTTLAAIAAIYVDAIRETQPEGPYYLAGYSAGGFIAFEVARQLQRSGQAVAFVALMDTTASRLRAPLLRRYGKYPRIFLRRPGASSVRFARALLRRFGWSMRWIRSGGATSWVPDLEANRFYDSLNMHGALRPYAGHVTLLRARFGSATDCPLPDSGWGPLCRGGLKVIEIEGEHETILNSDVESLADALARELASARERASESSLRP